VRDQLALAAGGWGVLMGLAPLLQIRTIRRTGSSAGVSIGSMAVLVVGFGLWLAYGLALRDAALVTTNLTALTVTLAAVAVTVSHRRSSDPTRRSPTATRSPAAESGPLRPRTPRPRPDCSP